jgi:predicted transcriptional regulator
MPSDAQRFASLIAGLEASGISRSEIANQCGLSRANVWRIAVGEARKPNYSTIRRIEHLYEQKVGPSPLRTVRR